MFEELIMTKNFLVLDIRTDEEHINQPFIPWSTKCCYNHDKNNLDIFRSSFMAWLEDFKRKFNKWQPILIYCRTWKRTKEACNILRSLWYYIVFWLEWWVWEIDNHPLEELLEIKLTIWDWWPYISED